MLNFFKQPRAGSAAHQMAVQGQKYLPDPLTGGKRVVLVDFSNEMVEATGVISESSSLMMTKSFMNSGFLLKRTGKN